MRRAFPLLALSACLAMMRAGGVWAIDTTEMPTPELQARYQGLTHELRCVQCQDEAIADSPVDIAAQIRRDVHDMLLAGKSDDDVRAWMVSRYGDFILFRPRFVLKNLWLWAAPEVLLIVGAWVAWRVIRQRARLVSEDREPLPDDGSP